MLDQPYMTDLIEANSMGHEPNLIDIYSASWGPTDDGRTVDGPRNATMRAIVRGVNEVGLLAAVARILSWRPFGASRDRPNAALTHSELPSLGLQSQTRNLTEALIVDCQ